MNSSSATRSSPQTRYRWFICALLFFATTINYIDRQILSLLKPILDVELGWTNAQFGMVNSAFLASYGVSVFFFGWFVDRFGTKIGFSVSIGAWSLAAMAHALVGSVGGFLGARIALGLGEGGNFPSAVKATAQWFPQCERAFATSLFNSGANVGAIAAPLIVPAIAYSLGWHWAFILAGLAGFAWLFLWIPLFDQPEKCRRVSPGELAFIESDNAKNTGAGDTAASIGATSKVTWGAVLRHRQAWSLILAKFITDPVWWFLLFWLPDFFKRTRGLDIKESWALLVTIYAIISVLSIAGGWITGFLIGRGWSATRARKTGLFTFALCVLPLLVVTWAGNWTAVILIGLAGAAHQAWTANLYTTASDMFPKRAVATLIGIGTAVGSIGGMGFPILIGIILDRIPGGYPLIFGFCAFAYLIGFGVNHLLAPRYEQIKNF
ncbi:MAG: MFS transporter [Opitutaceae bacterium]|jgi:ACS family hexuronate transporter-like MFS transporter|nr:MFS transporter [Opitutaceae bacterium]